MGWGGFGSVRFFPCWIVISEGFTQRSQDVDTWDDTVPYSLWGFLMFCLMLVCSGS